MSDRWKCRSGSTGNGAGVLEPHDKPIEGDDISTCMGDEPPVHMSSFVVWAPQNCRSVLEEAAIGYKLGSGTVCVPIQVEEYLSQDHGIL
jgi:hypothetical protein